jgi:FkbM family methyltransferase
MTSNLTIADYEKLDPIAELDVDGEKLKYAIPSTLVASRIQTLFTKEPATISWLNSLKSSDFLIDVGANVGLYSLYAAKIRGCRVVAFEPESSNFALLSKNIRINQIANLIEGYCIGLANESKFSKLYMHDMRIGGSNHSAMNALDHKLQPKSYTFAQGTYITTLDAFSQSLDMLPTALKIDVDGIEQLVVQGAMETIRRSIESVCIELNESIQQHQEVITTLQELGFHYEVDQVEAVKRKTGPFAGLAEYGFRKAHS